MLAGEARMVPALRRHLPGRVAARVVGSISGTRRESSAVLTARAAELLAGVEAEREDAAGDAVLTEAAGRGVAVAGLEPNCSSRGGESTKNRAVLTLTAAGLGAPRSTLANP